ncbi:hypothetical protein LWC34_45985 [Kibdelosporangium philippinense]|uniref:Uncharacterized protein n=1 Tax=Kibdelosporangium philippinense TaxID=211113 RepID=A0ABS8ZU13_9PSEU|nr:hypothetical protein [Kibdelosporangium philippinense]MCE7010106.1 hypothetical protein [Kibdelosporangium philippinense]
MSVLDPTDRTLLRTMASPADPPAVASLRGARPAGPPAAQPLTVELIVPSSGGIMVARQRILIGRQHARKVLTISLDETTIHVHDGPHLLATVPRTTDLVVTHKRAQNHYGTSDNTSNITRCGCRTRHLCPRGVGGWCIREQG